MGKIATKMPTFCLNRIRPLVKIRSPHLQSGNQENGGNSVDEEKRDGGEKDNSGGVSGRKIMIVVDSGIEAKNAVHWALSHSVQNQDTVVLVYVAKPSKNGDQSTNKGNVNKVPEFLTCMKNSCQLKRPGVHIEVIVVEGKDKGPAVVEAARKEGVVLLVVGQKKCSVTWRLMLMWAGNRAAPAGGVAEYCVQNATCMAIAVRRKSKKLGGYVITTKRQKDFWLLA